MTTLVEKAPAKINLQLSVGPRRADGYHELASVMQTVDVCDTLTVTAHTGGGMSLTCNHPDLSPGEDNLVCRAAVLFFQCTGVPMDGVTIHLHKVIPMPAGLGGGSADAAAALRALRRLYAPALPDSELETMAAALGSDVPFCVRGGTALAAGRGEKLSPLPPLPQCWAVLVKPHEAYSTAAMYRRIDDTACYDPLDAAPMVSALTAGDLPGVCAAMTNTFEKVLPPDAATAALCRRLKEQGAMGAMLSGSGSAVFGLFASREGAAQGAAAMQTEQTISFFGRVM
ncbi:MAG: 4-(cytidine 5'-diphospho)-2-C-methyl-D-erythritol kinase [Oscillospiraceae bacterium]|nr:4-(cytidine 5'-diphospho)-2-C-methyl-D-erythritol kinase [Oscillospiraceae bacterium]